MLYVIGTPIGNLEDITLRAIRILKEVDFVIAEDPSHSGKLLKHIGIAKPMTKIHQQSKPMDIDRVVKRLLAGESAGVITDAGTPGVADPGGVLVEACRNEGIEVVPIPGVSAVTTLLSVSGMPTDSYLFIGFLPKKKGRATLIGELASIDMPLVFFESPMRLGKTLAELSGALGGDRDVVIGRELTKMHEEIVVTTLEKAAQKYSTTPPKGEVVFLVSGK